ncbi:MAG: AraC family transcriptional regulator ligand-binding domain-containing protein [Pseudomonadota bacterium]
MSNVKRYPIAKSLTQMATLLHFDATRVLRRAGLSPDFLDNEGRGVTAQEYYALWQATFDEVGDATFPMKAAIAFAGSPFVPAVFAFSLSPNAEIGLSRLALFKPLVGPVELSAKRAQGSVVITIASTDDDAPMPPSAAAFEAVYFVECIRKFTGFHVVPVSVGLPETLDQRQAFERYFETTITQAPLTTLVLSLEDAQRPFVSENSEFWAWLEIDLKRQLAERESDVAIQDRVRAALIEILPSGAATADAVCKRLGMSKRSLQRRLKAEDVTFQSVLDATRSELSMKYLSKGDLNIDEISYLLAYRDPNSFYRAFQSWTGMTPAAARDTFNP